VSLALPHSVQVTSGYQADRPGPRGPSDSDQPLRLRTRTTAPSRRANPPDPGGGRVRCRGPTGLRNLLSLARLKLSPSQSAHHLPHRGWARTVLPPASRGLGLRELRSAGWWYRSWPERGTPRRACRGQARAAHPTSPIIRTARPPAPCGLGLRELRSAAGYWHGSWPQ
jgi:hypothetical protein